MLSSCISGCKPNETLFRQWRWINNPALSVAIYCCREIAGLPLNEIAEQVGKNALKDCHILSPDTNPRPYAKANHDRE